LQLIIGTMFASVLGTNYKLNYYSVT